MMNSFLACKTCAEAMSAGGDNAAGYAILFMLAVILPLAATMVFCFIRLAKRSSQELEPQYQDSFGV